MTGKKTESAIPDNAPASATQAETSDERAIAFRIDLSNIVEETATLAYQFEQAALGVVIMPAIWVLQGLGWMQLPGEVIGATIAIETLIAQFYFRKKDAA